MKLEEILKLVDHTLLAQGSTWEEIKEICDDGMKYHTASVCIPPYYVKKAREYMGPGMPITTVIGFPNGNTTTATKVFETKDALANGATEIDIVINIGELKAKNYKFVLDEINELKAACGNHTMKVIIECCLLTEEEKIKMCEIVTESKADYIKTSTGFSTGGATFEDIELFAKHCGPNIKIKASGGIASIEDARKFIELGAHRLGTSRLVKIAKAKTKTLKVEGMKCEHCEARVKNALEAVAGVESAVADHNANTAVVILSTDVTDDVLKETVEAQGYKVLAVE